MDDQRNLYRTAQIYERRRFTYTFARALHRRFDGRPRIEWV